MSSPVCYLFIYVPIGIYLFTFLQVDDLKQRHCGDAKVRGRRDNSRRRGQLRDSHVKAPGSEDTCCIMTWGGIKDDGVFVCTAADCS